MSIRSSFLRHIAQTSSDPDGFEVVRGEGIFLYNKDGNAFIDCISGISVSSLGHNHPKIIDAIRHQLDLHLHTHVYGEHITIPQVALGEKLAELLPPSLRTSYFTNSGAEAVEGALKLARKYTERYDIIACRHAYHGSTAGAESLRSDIAHTSSFRPMVPGIHHINFNSFDDINTITEKIAAVIIEPIQGEAGVIIPVDGYLAALKKKCKEMGVLLIFDEIQTGMGRTGSMWAFEQEDVIPDILLLAKSFGGGLPLGAFISSEEIMHVLSHDPPLGHLTTFGGNALSCAASLAAIQIITEENLPGKAIALGKKIRDSLIHHPVIREIRNRGLMMAIELKNPDHLHAAVKACKEEGLLVDWFLFNNRSIRLAPPLVINEDEIDIMCEKMWKALDTIH
ncbi:MAG TPA: aspartate aminotransferase family protein [Saprospiraceae bacterium]|nr:aspartate aminotransferase family protein [Saprospiraceae bacterium]